ncbi:rho guanine nucleotide exchange factor 33-like [Chanodichthys erythropterus]|uniref:rho guanine nucleotide exchange factor 33-like n=1 Tax=Chanodichthys erythropterus TaxID=933992 RepID=UPI00351DF6FF
MEKMKSHEGDMEREISKVQGMVCELRAGFSRALLELNQIQQGDTELQSQLEDTRHGCNKRALHLESLVLSLKEELEEVRCQFRQLCDTQDRKPPENPGREKYTHTHILTINLPITENFFAFLHFQKT